MYQRNELKRVPMGKDPADMLVDRRELLKLKLKSLAEESHIIRRMEQKTHGRLKTEMHFHRTKIVREEARHAHIAYGLIRGKTIEQMERPATELHRNDYG